MKTQRPIAASGTSTERVYILTNVRRTETHLNAEYYTFVNTRYAGKTLVSAACRIDGDIGHCRKKNDEKRSVCFLTIE